MRTKIHLVLCFPSHISDEGVHQTLRKKIPLLISLPKESTILLFVNSRSYFLQSLWPEGVPYKKICSREFPGGSVVRTLVFHHQGCGFNLWSGN